MSPALIIDENASPIRNPTLSIPRSAPWYSVPPTSVVSVEHPFIIKNVSKALQTLGGPGRVRELVELEKSGTEASLFLRPSDRMTKPIPSSNVATSNVLLRITIPKRTGRRRKRGSQGPFQDAGFQSKPSGEGQRESESMPTSRSSNALSILQGLRDNVDSCSIQAVGQIEQTHRFRSMPDFAYSTANSPFMKKMREFILPYDYDKMKSFKLDLSTGVKKNTDIIPPPSFTHFSIPFNYSYKQNPGIKSVVDSTGRLSTINTQSSRKIKTQLVAFDAEIVPQEPTDDTTPFEVLDHGLQRLIEHVRTLLDERPMWTRRALSNQMRTTEWIILGKHVYQYVGYMFRSGPWRDVVIRYGVDPRTDPKYRIYQSIMFQFDAASTSVIPKTTNANRRGGRGGARQPGTRPTPTHSKNSHVFDGVNVEMDGKMWQVCDITDPQLKELLATTELRKQCDNWIDGWYHNGTWAKARILMKAKMSYIIAGKGIPPDSNYTKLFAIPDVLNQSTEPLATFTKSNATVQEVELATFIRSLARASKSEQNGGDQGATDDGWASQSTEDIRHGGTNGVGGSESRRRMIELDLQEREQDLEEEERVNELVGVMDGEEDGEGAASSSEDEVEMEEDDDLESDGEE